MPASRGPWWGYHQLTDPWARRLVRNAGIRPGDLVLDIGAGTGAVTVPLLDAGARVLAVELHPGRAQVLRRRFRSHPVTVIQADAADLRLPRREFRVVSNPPFAAATGLLRRLLSPGSCLARADLVLPVPVAARWSAGRAPGAERWSRVFSVSIIEYLPSGAFLPPATSRTAVLRIERRPGPAGGRADRDRRYRH